ncbi:MAG TPA: glycosyltransferase family 39 protein [Blastocatellia bacterium]|nr:glycosyltransferase family 39 protein [Blastocatellia bacterium]
MASRIYPALILVFVAAAGTRLAFLHFAGAGNLTPPGDYHGLSNSLLANWTYVDKSIPAQFGFPTDLQRPPGYPFFLYLINPSSGVNPARVAFIQSILGGIFAVFLAMMATRLANARAGIMAGLFYAFDWVTIIHTPMLLAETLYAIALTGAVLVFAFYLRDLKPACSMLAGVLLGAAALIKPVAELQLGAFVLAWVVQPRRRINGLAFILGFALLVTPWMVRNYQRHQVYALSTIDASSLYFYIAHGAESGLQGRDLAQRINAAEADWNARSLSQAEKKEMMNDEAWKIIRQRWATVIKQSVIGFARTCLGTGRETLVKSGGAKGGGISSFWHTVLPLTQIGLLWLLAIAGVGSFWRAGLAPRPVVCLFAIVVLFALLPSASPAGYCRFRVHAVPILCILAAVGAWRIFSGDQMRFFRRLMEKRKTEK